MNNNYYTPINQMTKIMANELFIYKNDKLLWKESGSGRKKSLEVGCLDKISGYVVFGNRMTKGAKTYTFRVHNIVWNMHHGIIPKGLVIDHIDRNRSNNLLSNLRLVTQQVNGINTGLSKNNTSGIKGVSWNNRDKKWQATININGKAKRLGSWDDKLVAKMSYDKAAKEREIIYKNKQTELMNGE